MIWTEEHEAKLKQYLETHTFPVGVGIEYDEVSGRYVYAEESACSLAAINLAISGELTDKIPDCMSEVLGKAIIPLQDAMPDDMRNSARYRDMLITAPGTGRDKEQERLEVLMDWVWGTVLPQVQPIADNNGFGGEWQTMCEKRTFAAADAAADAAARAAEDAAYLSLYEEADTAECVAYRAAMASDYEADTCDYAAYEDYAAANAASAASAASIIGRNDFWQEVDPIGVLERMIAVGDNFNISSVTDAGSTDVT